MFAVNLNDPVILLKAMLHVFGGQFLGSVNLKLFAWLFSTLSAHHLDY